ncbi:Fur family iron response transcriptional regulator [Limibacillus sp. MBR-115]|jgi:Fur family iron response transcriptional regulator
MKDMLQARPYSHLIEQLKSAGLRPTKQRLALARLLFAQGDRHTTAEQLHCQAMDAGVGVSLATVYNTLHQFTTAGLLREVMVDPGRSYFDTNTSDHHHFFIEERGELKDIPGAAIEIAKLPEAPEGTTVRQVDIIIRVGQSKSA